MDERIHNYFSGMLSDEERLAFLREVEVDAELKKQFVAFQNAYALFNLGVQFQDKTLGQQKYNAFVHYKRKSAYRQQVRTCCRYAAAILLLIVSSSVLTYWLMRSDDSPALPLTYNTLYTPAGQRAQLVLQDGTEVWLNAKSKLVYPSRFEGKSRNVTVEGEAFFKVAKDSVKPFIVSAGEVEMKVLGTQFNVYSYPETGYVETSLLEGAVKVFFTGKEREGVVLKPNQQVTVSGEEMKVEPIARKERFLWREGIYAFENEPLIHILKKLELYYDVRIIVEDSSLFKDTYTGKFRQRDSLDDIFCVLQRIRNFKVERDTEHNIVTLRK